jgi:hypothetical protein
VTLEDLRELHPQLLPGLAAHPGVGFLMVASRTRGPVVLGASGSHDLRTGVVDGIDPLARFGPHAAEDLLRHDGLTNAPDILLNSRIDAGTDEVAAFEELVGCHGGLGGWQNHPVLVAPAGWVVREPLIGADAVHRQLVRWLEEHGSRPHSSGSGDATSGVPASAAGTESGRASVGGQS